MGNISREGIYSSKKEKKAGYSHRTATTTYPCCLPALGRFSRSWSCKTCRRKDSGNSGSNLKALDDKFTPLLSLVRVSTTPWVVSHEPRIMDIAREARE
jgi:hypothetical protein